MDGFRESSRSNAKATHKQSKATWRVAVGFLHPVLTLCSQNSSTSQKYIFHWYI